MVDKVAKVMLFLVCFFSKNKKVLDQNEGVKYKKPNNCSNGNL